MLVAQRVADGYQELPDAELLRIAEFSDCVTVAVDFQDGDVGIGIAAGNRGVKLGPVEERDTDFARPGNYVGVGKDEPVAREYKPEPVPAGAFRPF